MRKIKKILLGGAVLLILYTLFLIFFPLKKSVFYTNDERAEEFVFGKKKYPIVMTGSSLSGVFKMKRIFNHQIYFDLYLPYRNACTGVELIRRSNNIPKVLFVETNRIDKGIDTALMDNIFDEPFYSLKKHLPFLLKKNRFLPNIVDRIKTPPDNSSHTHRPPAVLYDKLLAKAQKEWWDLPNESKLRTDQNFSRLKETLADFAKKGCTIYLYEVPMDRSLYKSPLLTYQRNCFTKLSKDEGYKFIRADTSRSYNTGDGIHILRGDGAIYINYFLANLHQDY
jgi:hypothetical protein